MGSRGGIRITKVSEIRKNWKHIKEELTACFTYQVEHGDSWELKYNQEYLDKSLELPDKIDDLTNNEIMVKLLYMSNCDCPYLYEDFIITGEGDYLPRQMEILSNALRRYGEYIETWT